MPRPTREPIERECPAVAGPRPGGATGLEPATSGVTAAHLFGVTKWPGVRRDDGAAALDRAHLCWDPGGAGDPRGFERTDQCDYVQGGSIGDAARWAAALWGVDRRTVALDLRRRAGRDLALPRCRRVLCLAGGCTRQPRHFWLPPVRSRHARRVRGRMLVKGASPCRIKTSRVIGTCPVARC